MQFLGNRADLGAVKQWVEIAHSIIGVINESTKSSHKQAQWKAFLRRTVPDQQDVELSAVVTTIRTLLSPILTGIITGEPFVKQWEPKRGWTRKGKSK